MFFNLVPFICIQFLDCSLQLVTDRWTLEDLDLDLDLGAELCDGSKEHSNPLWQGNSGRRKSNRTRRDSDGHRLELRYQ